MHVEHSGHARGNQRSTSCRLASAIRPYWVMTLGGLLGTGLFAIIDAAAAYSVQPLINKGFINRETTWIRWLPWVILLVFVLRGLSHSLSLYAMAWVARKVVTDLRRALFDKLLKSPARFYDETSSGKIISHLIYDAEQVAQVSVEALSTFVQSLFTVVGLLFVMFYTSWRLSLVFCISAPLMTAVVRFTSRYIRRVSAQTQHNMGLVTEIAEDSIAGYKEVRLYHGEKKAYTDFSEALEKTRGCEMKVVITRAYSTSGIQIIAAFSMAMVIALAVTPNTATTLSAGAFASIVIAMLALLKPLKTLIQVNADIQRGLAGAQSLFTRLDGPEEHDLGTGDLAKSQGGLHFNHVSFTYPNRRHPALNDLDLTLKPGEVVAFVGRSGAGKSTLMSLLCQFYPDYQGTIYLDGVDIKTLTLASLRRQIAMVSQHIFLFHGTIAENIAYGQAHLSEAEIKTAVEQAQAWSFVKNLPDGLNTWIGKNGLLLSGGQRQRLAIARAFLKKEASILILDEATSALDPESEHLIQEAMDRLMRNRTTLVIAHRLSTVQRADTIVVLDAGRMIESGSHHDLLAKNGVYAQLQALQTGRGT